LNVAPKAAASKPVASQPDTPRAEPSKPDTPKAVAKAEAAARQATWLERRLRLDVTEPVPFENTRHFWRALAQPATFIMCVLAVGAVLYFARALLLPVLCAVAVGMTMGPVVGYATRRGMPSWLAAMLVVLLVIAAANVAVVMLAGPATEMLRRAPEIATAFKEKLYLLDRPIAAFYEIQNALGGKGDGGGIELNAARVIEGLVTIVTPAAVQFALQLVLFIGTLFFFILGRTNFRMHAVNFFSNRQARLRALKILNDIEGNLSGYLIVVTAINVSLGLVAVVMAYLLGLPYPLLWGALACVLNYVPYVGPSIVYVLLFLVGLLTYPTLWGALLPPAIYIAITLIEGQFLSPAIIGRQVLQIHPLSIFLGIAFWAWLWGPLGAFLATPILIVARVVFDHLYPSQKAELPG
jgi:predicted PurR-regulated permease PerM